MVLDALRWLLAAFDSWRPFWSYHLLTVFDALKPWSIQKFKQSVVFLLFHFYINAYHSFNNPFTDLTFLIHYLSGNLLSLAHSWKINVVSPWDIEAAFSYKEQRRFANVHWVQRGRSYCGPSGAVRESTLLLVTERGLNEGGEKVDWVGSSVFLSAPQCGAINL